MGVCEGEEGAVVTLKKVCLLFRSLECESAKIVDALTNRLTSVNPCCCDEVQAAGAKHLQTSSTAIPPRIEALPNHLIWYGDIPRSSTTIVSRWYHCSSPFIHLQRVSHSIASRLLPYATSDPQDCSKSLVNTRQRPGQLESWSFGTSDYGTGVFSLWGRGPQMEPSTSGLCMHAMFNLGARGSSTSPWSMHHSALTGPYHLMDAFCIQTRGSDRCILLLNVVKPSYEVTWPL